MSDVITNASPPSAKQKTGRRLWISIVAVAVLLAASVGAYYSVSNAQPAPQLNFKTITGEVIPPEALHGKVVMINFWATSCTTCIHEMPQMVETYKKYHQQGLEFIAVAMSYDPPNYVLNFTETRQLPFKVVLDLTGEIAQAYGNVKLTPTTFVIGRDGKVLKRYVGEPEFNGLHVLLEKALKS
jgi:peroxiredoxin